MSRLAPLRSSAAHPERGIVTAGAVRLGPLMAWPQVLADLGVEPDTFFAGFGLSSDHFEDPETVAPISLIGRMLRASAEMTGCDHLGILIGQRARLSSLGAVGVMAQSCPTAGDALRELEHHLQVQDRAAIISLEVEGRSAALSYQVTTPGVEAIDQIYCLVALVGRNILGALFGSAWRPDQVHLPIARRAGARLLREELGAPLRFDAERLAFVFPASDLQRPLATADPLLHRMMSERVAQLEAKLHRDLLGQVRDLMQTMVFVGDSRTSRVAGRLGLSLRTLNRRLADLGSSLHRIREEVWTETACQLLANTEKTASEIAQILGYSDLSAFTRAFRRWKGVAPTQWRVLGRRAR